MQIKKRSHCLYSDYFSIIFVLIFLAFFAAVDSVDAMNAKKNVLFISSYSESFMTVPDQIKGIQSAFDKNNINLEIEYMDSKRLDTAENKQLFYETLAYKFANLPAYDAIIVGDDNALQFILDYQDELFSQIPIVFFGINDRERGDKANANPYITGLIEENALSDNIGIAYRFNPNATKLLPLWIPPSPDKGISSSLKPLNQNIQTCNSVY